MWKSWKNRLDEVQVIIWYEKSIDLHPITEYLHPGLLPVGEAFSDNPLHNFPNLDWLIRFYAWQGVRKFKILSEEDFTGLDNFYSDFPELNIEFININLLTYIKNMEEYKIEEKFSIIVSGFLFCNADFLTPLLIHSQKSQQATLLSFRGLKYRVGLVELNSNGLVTDFKEKPTDKTKLVNSNILIITNYKIKEFNMDELIKKYDEQSSSITQLIHHIKNTGRFRNIELGGVEGETLWVTDLSSIETWIKLDIDNFIKQYSFLLSSSLS